MLVSTLGAVLALLGPAPDVVVLEDGSRLVGAVLSPKGAATVEWVGPLGRIQVPRNTVAEVLDAQHFAATLAATPVSGAPPHALRSMAHWALERGLYDACFERVDALLAQDGAGEDPGNQELLAELVQQAVLGGHSHAERLGPDELAKLLSFVGGPSPSRARVVSAWWAAEDPALRAEATRAALKSQDAGIRAAALALLGPESVEPDWVLELVRRSLDDPDALVRRAACDQLAQHHAADRGVLATFARATRSNRKDVRSASYEGLAALGNPRGIAPLIASLAALQSAGAAESGVRSHIFVGEQRAYVRDFEVEIAQGAVIADPVIGVLSTGALLDVRVVGSSMSVGAERGVLVGALERLSGQEFGADVDLWAGWWERNRQQRLTAWEEALAAQAKQMQ